MVSAIGAFTSTPGTPGQIAGLGPEDVHPSPPSLLGRRNLDDERRCCGGEKRPEGGGQRQPGMSAPSRAYSDRMRLLVRYSPNCSSSWRCMIGNESMTWHTSSRDIP